MYWRVAGLRHPQIFYYGISLSSPASFSFFNVFVFSLLVCQLSFSSPFFNILSSISLNLLFPFFKSCTVTVLKVTLHVFMSTNFVSLEF